MARSIGESDSNPTIPDLKVKIPTIDELMWPPQPPPWWQLLPPPAPSKNDGPFGPVPIIPPLPPPPLEVDPPSRPPEWLFGPPYISKVPTQARSSGQYAQSPPPGNLPSPVRNPSPWSVFGTGAPSVPFVANPMQEKLGGLLGMMAEAGLIDPSNPDRPAPGGLLALMQENYLRNN